MHPFDALRRWIGYESEPIRAPGPIEWSDVRRYINAVGERNSLWRAGDLQPAPGRIGAPVPPAMILDVLRPAVISTEGDRGERGFPSPGGLAALIEVPGEQIRLNVSTEIEWMRPPRIGDWVTVRFKIVDIAVKEGHAGPAVFITEERRYVDQAEQPLAVVRQTTVRMLSRSAAGVDQARPQMG